MVYCFQTYVDLYMDFEKSSWKNQVRQTWFLVYFELDFFRNWFFVELDFSNLIFQNSSTDQQGVCEKRVSGGLPSLYFYRLFWKMKQWHSNDDACFYPKFTMLLLAQKRIIKYSFLTIANDFSSFLRYYSCM